MAVVKSLMKARKLAAEMRQLAKKKKPDPVKTRKAYKLFVEGKDKELYPLFVDAKNKVPQGEFLEANFPDVAFTAPNGKMYVPSKGAQRTKGEKPKGTGDPVRIPDEKTRIKLIEEGYITDKVKRTEDAPFGKVTAVAARPGWHSSQMPVATHIGPQDIKINEKQAQTLLKAGITPEAIKKRGKQFYVKRRAEDHVYAEVDMADDIDYQSMLAKEGKTDINDRVPVGGSYKYVDGQADSDKWVVGGDMRVNRVLSREETKALQNELGVKDLPLKKDVENILGKKFYQGGSVTGDTMEQGVDDYILAKTESNQIKMDKGGLSKQKDEDIQKGEQAKVGVKDSDLTQLSRNDLMTELYRRGRTPEDVMTGRNLTGPEIEAVATLNELNKGGMPKQMEMFDNGGLKDEGGMIDEVSGNDVPTGSTREEVRDDIPAQLSEGEFVLPADVVRFHGLEKIMELRDEAKAGLAKMEAMGQMGNSEEATLPDEMPFSLDDLDMEDEDEPQEMADGGYVMVEGKPMPIPRIGGQLPPITTRPMPETKNMAVGGFTSPTGTYQVPTNIATQPSYFQNYQQSTAPFQPFTGQTQTQQPIQPLQQQQSFPSFQTLMPTVGGKRETIEYRNEAGQKMFIPFVDGKPIYPIPEGYSKYTEETETTPEKQPTIQSTSVRQQQQDSGDDNVLSQTSQVRGTDNSLIDTRFGSQSNEKIKDSFSKMTESQRGLAVINAKDSAVGSNTFMRNLATGALSVIGGPVGMAAGAYDAGSRMMGGQGLNLGASQPDALNNIVNSYGYFEDDTDPEGTKESYLNSLSQAVYGLSLEQATAKLGVVPTFTKGYKDGQIDPKTGGTYVNGQATSDDGTVSYGSLSDAGSGFTAMAKSGFAGGLKDAQRVANKTTASDKDRARAQTYIDVYNKEQSNKQQEKAIDKGKANTIADVQERTQERGYSASTKEAATRDDSQGSISYGGDNDDVGSNEGVGQGGDSYGGLDFNTGGLAKRKSKVKKMKRGGLASR